MLVISSCGWVLVDIIILFSGEVIRLLFILVGVVEFVFMLVWVLFGFVWLVVVM